MAEEKGVYEELYRRLRQWSGLGGIEHETYVVGLHVLQRMVKHNCVEVGASWSEFMGQGVVRLGEALAPPVSPNRYHFYGALQQLQEVLGVFSHITSDGLEAAIEEAGECNGVCPHFTASPGVDSHIIGESTLLVFAYRPWAGLDADSAARDLYRMAKPAGLPGWLHRAPVRRKG